MKSQLYPFDKLRVNSLWRSYLQSVLARQARGEQANSGTGEQVKGKSKEKKRQTLRNGIGLQASGKSTGGVSP